jgi:hypothetical protein
MASSYASCQRDKAEGADIACFWALCALRSGLQCCWWSLVMPKSCSTMETTTDWRMEMHMSISAAMVKDNMDASCFK